MNVVNEIIFSIQTTHRKLCDSHIDCQIPVYSTLALLCPCLTGRLLARLSVAELFALFS